MSNANGIDSGTNRARPRKSYHPRASTSETTAAMTDARRPSRQLEQVHPSDMPRPMTSSRHLPPLWTAETPRPTPSTSLSTTDVRSSQPEQLEQTPITPSPATDTQQSPFSLLSALAPALQTIWDSAARHSQTELDQRECTRSECQRIRVELEKEKSRCAVIDEQRGYMYSELLRLLKENETLKEKVVSMSRSRSTRESIAERKVTHSRPSHEPTATSDAREPTDKPSQHRIERQDVHASFTSVLVGNTEVQDSDTSTGYHHPTAPIATPTTTTLPPLSSFIHVWPRAPGRQELKVVPYNPVPPNSANSPPPRETKRQRANEGD